MDNVFMNKVCYIFIFQCGSSCRRGSSYRHSTDCIGPLQSTGIVVQTACLGVKAKGDRLVEPCRLPQRLTAARDRDRDGRDRDAVERPRPFAQILQQSRVKLVVGSCASTCANTWRVLLVARLHNSHNQDEPSLDGHEPRLGGSSWYGSLLVFVFPLRTNCMRMP